MEDEIHQTDRLMITGTCLVSMSLNVIVIFIAIVNLVNVLCFKKMYHTLVIIFYTFAILYTAANLLMLTLIILNPKFLTEIIKQVQIQVRVAIILNVGLHITQGLSFYWFSVAM